MPTQKTPKPKLSKADRAILAGLSESYRDALLYYQQGCAAESQEHGHPPMSIAAVMEKCLFDFLADTQKRDPLARTAFEILIAPNFIHSLKAWYEAGMPEVPRG